MRIKNVYSQIKKNHYSESFHSKVGKDEFHAMSASTLPLLLYFIDLEIVGFWEMLGYFIYEIYLNVFYDQSSSFWTHCLQYIWEFSFLLTIQFIYSLFNIWLFPFCSLCYCVFLHHSTPLYPVPSYPILSYLTLFTGWLTCSVI